MSDQQWTRERVLKLISANSTKVIGGVGLEPGDLQQWFMNSGIAYNIATTVMDDMQAKLDAAQQRNAELSAQLSECAAVNESLMASNDRLFDRAAKRLAHIKELQAWIAERQPRRDDSDDRVNKGSEGDE